METNVTGLLRNFREVRKAAFAGQKVIIHTRDGNLILQKEEPEGQPGSLLGAMKGELRLVDDYDPEESPFDFSDWKPEL